MSEDRTAPRTRRAFLAGAIGGSVAAAAHLLGRPLPASAADGDAVVIGQDITAASTTTIRNTTTDSPVLIVRTNGSGVPLAGIAQGTGSAGVQGTADAENSAGVAGGSVAGTGVYGLGDHGIGVHGQSTNAIAVRGDSSSADRPAIVARAHGGATGVVGVSGDNTSPVPRSPLDTGVFGFSAGIPGRPATAAVGVHGRSTIGTGVLAQADGAGTALSVKGKAVFSRSGVVTVSSGRSSVTKSLAGVTSSSLVFAVVRTGDGGAWVRKVSPAAGKFTILMNKAVGTSTSVTWIVFG